LDTIWSMPRLARVVIPNVPHHVTQRGNRREDVFFSDDDRGQYFRLLDRYSRRYGLDIQAYCLMSNHVHLVVVPRTAASLAATLKPLHTRYTQYVNESQGLTGRLWQGRFHSCPLGESHLYNAVRYVERNPVQAGIVQVADEYRWSSAAGHAGRSFDGLLSDPCDLTTKITPAEWRDWLSTPWAEEDEFAKNIRQSTHTGRPAGGLKFLQKLESLTGRTLIKQKAGRHKKKTQTDK
jgi:putative transposase